MMKDVFNFQSPMGILGKVANTLFLKSYMTNFLENRNKIIKEFAESGRWKEVLPENGVGYEISNKTSNSPCHLFQVTDFKDKKREKFWTPANSNF